MCVFASELLLLRIINGNFSTVLLKKIKLQSDINSQDKIF